MSISRKKSMQKVWLFIIEFYSSKQDKIYTWKKMDGMENIVKYSNSDSEKSNVRYVDEMFKFVYTVSVSIVDQRVDV